MPGHTKVGSFLSWVYYWLGKISYFLLTA